MGYTTSIKEVIYFGSHYEHVRRDNGVLEIKSFPNNIEPFDPGMISEVRLFVASYPSKQVFEIYELIYGHDIMLDGYLELTKGLVKDMIAACDDIEGLDDDIPEFLAKLLNEMEDSKNYIIELI